MWISLSLSPSCSHAHICFFPPLMGHTSWGLQLTSDSALHIQGKSLIHCTISPPLLHSYVDISIHKLTPLFFKYKMCMMHRYMCIYICMQVYSLFKRNIYVFIFSEWIFNCAKSFATALLIWDMNTITCMGIAEANLSWQPPNNKSVSL